MPPMAQRVLPQHSDPETMRNGLQDWEWVWESEETYSEFNFHDYSKPYQEAESLCGSQGEELSSVDWLIDFKLENYCTANNIDKQLLLPRRTQELEDCGEGRMYTNHYISHLVKTQPESSLESQPKTSSIWRTCFSAEKPPYNYNELIEQALLDKGKLTVDEIYQWIAQRFPYYKLEDPQWKGCIRHRLSINRAFIKVEKVGKCHLWTYQEQDKPRTKPACCTLKHIKNHWKKQKLAELEMERKKLETKENLKVKLTGSRKSGPKTPNMPKTERKRKYSADHKKSCALKEITMNIPKQRNKNIWKSKQVLSKSAVTMQRCETPEYDMMDNCQMNSPGYGDLEIVNITLGTSPRNLKPLELSNVDQRAETKPLSSAGWDKPAIPMPMDFNSCRGLSTKPLPPGISALLDADSTFLNPISFREVIVESGLLDDPPSTRTMSVIPNTQFQVPVADVDATPLFGDILLIN